MFTSPTRSRYPEIILISCSFFWLFVQVGRFLFPPLAIPIQDAFNIGNTEFGFAITSLWAAYALMQFPSGVVNDYTDPRLFLTIGLMILSVAFGSVLFVSSYSTFILILLIIGFGTSLFLLTSRLYVSRLYEGTKGRAIGIHTASGDIGGFLAPIIATALLGVVVWRIPFAVICVVLFVGGLWLYYIVEGEFQLHLPEMNEFGSESFAVLKDPKIGLVTLLYSLVMIVLQSMYAFVPIYLYTVKDLSLGASNLMLTVFFAVGVIIRPIGGWVSDSLNRFWMLLVCAYSVAGSLAILVLLANHLLTIILSIVLLGGSLKVLSPIVQAFIIESVEEDSIGASYGLTRSVYIFIGSLGPTILGASSDAVGFNPSLLTLSGVIIVTVTAVVILLRRHTP